MSIFVGFEYIFHIVFGITAGWSKTFRYVHIRMCIYTYVRYACAHVSVFRVLQLYALPGYALFKEHNETADILQKDTA